MPQEIITTNLCDYGCNHTAKFYFPYSKTYCCSNNVGKCPENSKMRAQARKDLGNYKTGAAKGLQTKKNTVLDDGRTILEHSIEKQKQAWKVVDDCGLTLAQRTSVKMVETRQTKIDKETGLSVARSASLKAANTARNKIDLETGLNTHQMSALKANATKLKIDENGQNWFDRVKPGLKAKAAGNGDKLHQKRLADVDENGLDHYARRTLKMLNDIDESGLNAIERSQKKMKRGFKRQKFKETQIHFQGNYEKHFLESLESEFGLEWMNTNITNGKFIQYFNPEDKAYRNYIPDFVIGNTLYEIKSSYTWNKNGKDLMLESVNKAKIKAAKDQGYNVILVLNGVQIPQ